MLGEAVDLLRKINRDGLLTAIAEGTFGITKRPPDGGRGLDGVIERAPDYFNPASEFLGRDNDVDVLESGIMTGPVIRPYGDTTGDGQVQVSFTLPVAFGNEEERALAEGAALQLAGKMGLDAAMVVHAKGMGPDFTFFIVYGRVSHLVDLSEITVARRAFPLLSPAEINLRVRTGLGRKLVVLGACIGTDAHTVGIDAILNVKGHAGEKGLEYYREMRVVNLGAQVDVADLVARAQAERADAVLVSQVVTQREAHLAGARQLSAAFRAAYPERAPLLVVGGPRYDPAMAGDLGVDKIFGRGTTPREVASYLVHVLAPEPAAARAAAGGAA